MKSRIWSLGVLAAAALVLTGCPEKRRPAGSTPAKPATPATPAGGAKGPEAKGPVADYARTLDKTEKKAAEVTGLTTLNQGVQQFNVIEGRFPRTLDELVVTRYLPKLPAAPRGKRYIYNPKTGEVIVEELPSSSPTAAPEAPVTPAVEAAPAATGAISISVPAAAPAPEEVAPAAEKPAE